MACTVRTLVVVVLAASALTGPAVANGGGGGGGGSMSMPSSGEDPAAAYQAGVAALNQHNYREAIRELRTARRAAPSDGVVNYALGLAYLGNGDVDEAKTALERSAGARNAPAGAHMQLGLVYLLLGQREDAVAQQTALTEALAACDAGCGDARRAQLQAALDQLTQALDAPAGAPATDPATTGWNFPDVQEGRQAYAEAVGLINRDRYVEAFAALEQARQAVGPDADVLNYMGFVSRKLGRYDDALAYYRAALSIEPSHLGALEYLGELYIQMGDLERAHTQLARLDQLCAYGCAQREELARWIERAE